MALLAFKNIFRKPQNNIPPGANYTPAEEALKELGYSPMEIKIYRYFFLYGPVDLENAPKGVNFPKDISAEQFKNAAEQLKSQGYLLQSGGGSYDAAGIGFLIQKTSGDPKLKKINQELKDWEQKSIE